MTRKRRLRDAVVEIINAAIDGYQRGKAEAEEEERQRNEEPFQGFSNPPPFGGWRRQDKEKP